ncbi:FRG domain-containing protein [Flavobacterium sp. W20_MBD1_R3]|uniref:FRG domain-containing protein n=1 Tax=Flavobacterium sp. W20_MBD1_R3 TaxID=3240278 RepID=UPI003F93B457
MYKERNFKSWRELKNFLSSFNSNWIFRGQTDYKWKLESAIDRVSFNTELPNQKYLFEQFCIIHFKRNPHLYSEKFNTQSDFQVLSLLQHYGSPTRLLDFSTSPYVAAFFAANNSENDGSIYAINSFELLSTTNYLFGTKYDDGSDEMNNLKKTDGISNDDVFKVLVLGSEQRKFVELVQPFFLFDRMIQQNGAFLCQGDINNSFEENLKSNYEFLSSLENPNPYYKIKIKHEWKAEIIRDLFSMNISSATLFPDIEGYLKSLKNKFEIYTQDRGDSIAK